MLAFSILSATSGNIVQLLIWRLGVGLAFGIGAPAGHTLLSEIAPAQYRLFLVNLAYSLFAFGSVYASSLLWFISPDLNFTSASTIPYMPATWRLLLLLAAIPAFPLLICSVYFLPESPRFLLFVRHDRDRAYHTITYMQKLNSCFGLGRRRKVRPPLSPPVLSPIEDRVIGHSPSARELPHGSAASTDSIDLESERLVLNESVWTDHLETIFSRSRWFTTLLIWAITFTINIIFYGLLYALPHFFQSLKSTAALSPAAQLWLSSFFDLLGAFVALFFALFYRGTRKSLLVSSYFCLTVLLCLFFVIGLPSIVVPAKNDVQLVIVCAAKLLINVVFVVLTMYTLEAYPTRCRSLGFSLACVAGRVGSVLSPVIYEAMVQHLGSSSFYGLVALLCVMGVSVGSLLPAVSEKL
eukprot:Platyproteum_vivax@DN7176_c0_g1_i1.p1